MSKIDLIKNIGYKRGSRVITYVTSDRPGPVGARVAMDIIPIMSEQLRQIGKVDKIDLFLYTAGGDTMVPWRLVSMIRDYCNTFSVLIPYKAHSAGTMIALGADEIVMSDLSEISPIDPSTANIFNPNDPNKIKAADVRNFALLSIGITTFFAGLVIGVFRTGKALSGLKYAPIFTLIGIGIFLGVNSALKSLFASLLS